MTDRQWKGWQDDLKKLHDSQPDGPQDPAMFKQRVLEEYRKRAQQEARTKWVGRTVTGLTAAAAVWLGLMIAHPSTPSGDVQRTADRASTSSSSSSTPPSGQSPSTLQKNSLAANDTRDIKQLQAAGPEQAVQEFFDLLVQKRTADTQTLMTEKMKVQQLAVPPNLSNPHMTGYTVQPLKQGDAEQRYTVALTWTNFGSGARHDTYEVTVQKENNVWRIADVSAGQSFSYSQDDQQNLSLQESEPTHTNDGHKVFMQRGQLRAAGSLTNFAINPRNAYEMLFVIQGDKPTLYKMKDGGEPGQLAVLPPGVAGDVIWTEDDMLAINFTPQGAKDATLLFYDAKTGQPASLPWLSDVVKGIDTATLHVEQTLPNHRLRVRSGTLSMLLDLQAKNLGPDANAQQPVPAGH